MNDFKNADPMPIVFTAQSKQFFYCRDAVCEFVLRNGCLPLNPFRVFGYFLDDRVNRDLVRRGNNNLILIANQVWVFGIIANGVLSEVEYALSLGKPLRFFNIATRADEIVEVVTLEELKFEPEIHSSGTTRKELLERIGVEGNRSRSQLGLFHDPTDEAEGKF